MSIEVASTTAHMSAAEATHAAQLPLPRRRSEWLAGRTAVKHAVQAYLHRHFGDVVATRDIVVDTIGAGPCAGKPVVDYDIEIGISHSGDFAIGVCASGPVGIDIERNRELAPLLVAALGAPIAADPGSGRPRLDGMGPPLRWACREAVLKCFGFGLRIDPREVELTRWCADGLFHWAPGPRLRRAAAGTRWPHRGWAFESSDYSLALVW
ncbi:4'-phosphopantetheinyl transferase family protein [Nocardia rhizosphaerihabitans]|uniref:4'-phosphopantetheinyl transferase family protein n=1 Tax=Nocardia rhizosphaerihabitans TaxID=1691570 RepID=UPI00366E8D4B